MAETNYRIPELVQKLLNPEEEGHNGPKVRMICYDLFGQKIYSTIEGTVNHLTLLDPDKFPSLSDTIAIELASGVQGSYDWSKIQKLELWYPKNHYVTIYERENQKT